MAQPRKAYEKKNKHQINQFIKATKVRLISEDGQQLGVVEINDALDQAKSASLDLVQMNDDPKTPVCKLMDYGKHLFDQKKQKAASKKKTKKTQLKEIKFRPGTDENDYQIKMRNIIKVHSGAAKRFKKTGSGLKRKHANKSHILTKMTTKSKRQLRGTTSLAAGDEKLVKRMFKEKS